MLAIMSSSRKDSFLPRRLSSFHGSSRAWPARLGQTSTSFGQTVVPGQFDDAPDSHGHNDADDATTMDRGIFANVDFDTSPASRSMSDAKKTKPPSHLRDIVLGVKAGPKVSEEERNATTSKKTASGPSGLENTQAVRRSLPSSDHLAKLQQHEHPLQPQQHIVPAHQGQKRLYAEILPKPHSHATYFQPGIVAAPVNRNIPPFILSKPPPKRPRPKQPSVRLDDLGQHPNALLLPGGVAPLLQKHGQCVAPGGDGSSPTSPARGKKRADSPSVTWGLPLHNFVNPDPFNPIQTPSYRDILQGRGGHAPQHAGNVFFRSIIAKYKIAYHVAAKGDKKKLAENLVNYFRIRNSRFLEKLPRSNTVTEPSLFYEIGDARAVAKVAQALREGGASDKGNNRNVQQAVDGTEVIAVDPGTEGDRNAKNQVDSNRDFGTQDASVMPVPDPVPSSGVTGYARSASQLAGNINRATATRTFRLLPLHAIHQDTQGSNGDASMGSDDDE